MTRALKPCPFCGGEARPCKMKRKGAVPNEDEDGYAHYIRCLSCAACGGWTKGRYGAVTWWNMRNGKR